MLDQQKHHVVLFNILKDIYLDSQLLPLLGFKGGTACYVFYDLPRFSVDLDFDLLDSGQDLYQLSEKILAICSKHGEVKDFQDKNYTLFYSVSYEPRMTNVKVEISKRPTQSAYEIKQYIGMSMNVMKKEDMFANKLLALLERKSLAGRDIYDIWYFLSKNWDINENSIAQRAQMDMKAYLTKCLDFIEQADEKVILSGLGEVLDSSTKQWVRKSLKKELSVLIKMRIEAVYK